MASSLSSFEDFELLQFDQDSDLDSLALSLWEFIDISDADDTDSTHSHPHSDSEPTGPTFAPIASPVTDPTRAQGSRRQIGILDLAFQTPLNFDYLAEDDDVSGEEEEEEEAGDVYGLDDELVPWSVSDKVGRERMRKLGKRTFAKMQSSKRSPYLVVRPGCVRGKHGLGLKHVC